MTYPTHWVGLELTIRSSNSTGYPHQPNPFDTSDPERAFENALRMGLPSTITADENIEAVERIVMRDRQISIRRLAEELAIIHEIMNNHMGMKKAWTRWVPKLLTQFNVPIVSILLSRASATQRSKFGQVF